MSNWRRKLISHTLPWLLLAVAMLLVLTQVRRPEMLAAVWVPWAEVGVLAIIMTAIILTGGIDLSIGSMVALCAMVQAVLFGHCGWSIESAACVAIVTGICAGGLNGLLVVAGLSPLVTTLATMAFYRGLAMTISGANRVAGFPETFLTWKTMFGFPTQFGLLFVTGVTAWIVIHHTRFGRWCYAMGDNRLAARFAAVPVSRVEGSLYMASGLVCALVAVLNTMRHNAAVPDAYIGVELQAIACVVVGGTLITGGHGGILRTLLGLAVISLLDIGLQFSSTRVAWITAEARLIVIGLLLIVVAVWNQRLDRAV